jgi:hypothetical protein
VNDPANAEQVARSTFQQLTAIITPNYPFSYTVSSASWQIIWLDLDYSSIGEVDLSANPTAATTQLNLPANYLDIGVYQIIFMATVTTGASSQVFYGNASTYIEIITSGLEVFALQNGLDTITIGINQSLSLTPRKYSYDLDELINMDSLSFVFYCQVVNSSAGFVNDLDPTIYDLLTLKMNSSLDEGGASCFNSSNGFYFDSTTNVLSIKSSSLGWYSNAVNQFIVTTSNPDGATFSQMFNVIVDPNYAKYPVLSME